MIYIANYTLATLIMAYLTSGCMKHSNGDCKAVLSSDQLRGRAKPCSCACHAPPVVLVALLLQLAPRTDHPLRE